MNTNTLPPQTDDDLKTALLVSLGAHGIVFIVLFVRAVLYPSAPLRLDDAIRVDIVALPDKGQTQNLPPPLPEPPAAQPAPPKQEAPPVEAPKPVVKSPPQPEAPKVNLKKTRKDQEAALKRLEALNKIESMIKNDKSNTKVASPEVVKGNEVSKGAALKGIVRLEHDNYLRDIDTRVRSRWNLPRWLANANLSVRVRLFVDSNGNLTKRMLVKSSNNEVFDTQVMAAVEASLPFPPPPGSLVGILAIDGLEIEFSPNQ